MDLTLHITCVVCKQPHKIKVDNKDMAKYQNGAKVQEAFPYLSADDRELIISKTCGRCFDEMFKEPEE